MLSAASLVIGCGYPALPPVGGSADGGPGDGGSAANGPHVTLDWEVAQPLPSTLTFAPIVPAPKVRIAPLDAANANTALAAFTDATYTADGTIAIPDDYLNHLWRLEYTLADGVPHEVQWQPDDRVGHIALPLFGRPVRDPVPSGAGYTITPTGGPASFNNPHVFTTGLWTEGIATPGTAIDFDLTRSTSLSGPNGASDPAFGDQGFLIDYKLTPGGCRVAIGGAAFDPTVHAGTHTTVAPAWNVDNMSSLQGTDIPQTIGDRFKALNGLATYVPNATTIMFGISPSTVIPGLTVTPPISTQLYNAQLPVPVMLTLLECPLSGAPGNAMPLALSQLAAYPKVFHTQLVALRTALGVSLTSGMETVVVESLNSVSLGFLAPLTTQFALTTNTGKVALDGASEQINIGAAHGTFTFDFTPESGTSLHADYYEVTLHQITNNSMSTVRVYTVTSPSVKIDGTLITPNTDYVFEVRAITGHPQAAHGDFATVSYPYGMTIVYPRTFSASSI